MPNKLLMSNILEICWFMNIYKIKQKNILTYVHIYGGKKSKTKINMCYVQIELKIEIVLIELLRMCFSTFLFRNLPLRKYITNFRWKTFTSKTESRSSEIIYSNYCHLALSMKCTRLLRITEYAHMIDMLIHWKSPECMLFHQIQSW